MKIVNQTSNQLKLRLIPVLCWMVAGLFAALVLDWIATAKGSTLTCNRTELAKGSCKVVQSGLLGSEREIPLSALQGATVERSKSDYRVVLLTTANSEVPLTLYYSSGESEKYVIASRINDFVRIPGKTSLVVKQGPGFGYYLYGGIFFAASLFTVYLSPIETCLFDKTLGSFNFKRQGLFGTEVIKHRICEIADIQVKESPGSKGGTYYQVIIVLVSGDRLPLTLCPSSGKKSTQKTASCIRKFLNLDEQFLS